MARTSMLALLRIYDLWTQPIDRLGDAVRMQNHPANAEVKWRLEEEFIAHLDDIADASEGPGDVATALRRIARGPGGEIYDWIAQEADWNQLVTFLAIEGGPDAGFDDLVAACQIGIRGEAKVVLGANYWDEMGRGDPDAVHTVLHDRLVDAIDLPRIPREELSRAALERIALNGLLATNRFLQPEMIGALGLLELQAGPRCRAVVKALTRLRAPSDTFPFYEEHANTDPRHGKEWLDGAVTPLVEEHPEWAAGIVRGAQWRAAVNRQLFDQLLEDLRARSVLRSA